MPQGRSLRNRPTTGASGPFTSAAPVPGASTGARPPTSPAVNLEAGPAVQSRAVAKSPGSPREGFPAPRPSCGLPPAPSHLGRPFPGPALPGGLFLLLGMPCEN